MQLILIRGLPGSGKTTLAKSLVIPYIETDMYFTTIAGEYIFDASKLPQAHAWCQEQTRAYIQDRRSIAVCNTFSRRWELQPYLDLAKEFRIKPTLIECKNQFQSIHDVPKETIQKMKNRWEEITL